MNFHSDAYIFDFILLSTDIGNTVCVSK